MQSPLGDTGQVPGSVCVSSGAHAWGPETCQVLAAGCNPPPPGFRLPQTDPAGKSLGGTFDFPDRSTQSCAGKTWPGLSLALSHLVSVPWLGPRWPRGSSSVALGDELPQPSPGPVRVLSPEPLLNPPEPESAPAGHVTAPQTCLAGAAAGPVGEGCPPCPLGCPCWVLQP